MTNKETMAKEQIEDIKEFGDVYHTSTGLVTYKRKGKYYLQITEYLLEEISVNVFCKLNGIGYFDMLNMKN